MSKPNEPVRVQVALRVRPLVPREISQGTALCVRFTPNEPQIICGKDVLTGGRAFTFDSVFTPDSMQSEIFEECVEPLIEQCFAGFNATILAYGQTGSGKTYTMGSAMAQQISEDEQGIIPRVINKIFDKVDELNSEGKQYTLRVSFLELYNEDIKDMFSPEHPPSNFQIREEKMKGVYVTGLTEAEISTKEQMRNVLMVGSTYRTVGQTEMNANSSRSHAIFTIIIREGLSQVTSKFHFVDLAGSERLARTKAEGNTMKEGISINSGLLALGNVINALGDPKRRNKHVPYRDSKLTRILQDSLGGNSQTLMIACASPALINYEETLNTLKYADRARQIKNKPVINLDPVALELATLRKQVQILRNELLKYKEGGAIEQNAAPSNETNKTEATEAKEKKRMTELEEEIKKLKENNARLQSENNSIEMRANELKERVIKLQTEKEVDQLRIASKEGNIDFKFEEIIAKHVEEIEDLKDKLSKTEADLHVFKSYNANGFEIPEEVGNALQFNLDDDFNLQISASTQKLLEELQKSDLFDFDTSPSYVATGSVISRTEDYLNGDNYDFGISDSTSELLAQLELSNFQT